MMAAMSKLTIYNSNRRQLVYLLSPKVNSYIGLRYQQQYALSMPTLWSTNPYMSRAAEAAQAVGIHTTFGLHILGAIPHQLHTNSSLFKVVWSDSELPTPILRNVSGNGPTVLIETSSVYIEVAT